ncbi:hypothetical protein RHI9324_03283 [Rhizobium sp. CECT 9324]|nr:hypothetical protein RHI9324_03283 [Rhizobium sp. CECT 9324]
MRNRSLAFALWDTPLCHSVTSPPQGGRSVAHVSQRKYAIQVQTIGPTQLSLEPLSNGASGIRTSISPLVGEMPGRAEGGTAPAKMNLTTEEPAP